MPGQMFYFHRAQSFEFTVIAESGERFVDFAPYVAAVDERGVVTFQAGLRAGGSGVFCGDGGPLVSIIDPTGGDIREVCSHPDRSSDAATCFYGDHSAGFRGVFLVRDGQLHTIARGDIGPLGPTMNERGDVAYRATRADGVAGIHVGRVGATMTIAETGDRFHHFEGLPVIAESGMVAFRAALRAGGHGIYLHAGVQATDGLETVVETGAEFRDLGLFPIVTGACVVAFSGTLRDGRSGVFVVADGQRACLADTDDGFASIRGVNMSNGGATVFYATPPDADIGIYAGRHPVNDRIFGIGDRFRGAVVTDFVLNPVSMNDAGQLAIRAQLSDGRQFILRADPTTAPRLA